MGINAGYILAGINGGGASGAEVAWFAPLGTTAPTDATTALASGTSEVQTITITGTPTGGTFTLGFGGQTTSAIAYNATGAAVQAALQALSTIGTGNVTVSGGPGPGTPYVVTFSGGMANTDAAAITATGSFTGGTTPTIAVTTTTPGVSGWLTAGLVSDDGVTKGVKENSKDITAFGLAVPVRKIVTSSEVSLKMTFLESNRVSVSVYNRLPLAGTGALAVSSGAFTVTEGVFRAQRYAFVMDVVDGTNHIRAYAPSVEVTDRADQQIKAGEVISYDVTLTAYPGSDGVAITTYHTVTGLT